MSGLGALTRRELKKWYKDPVLFFMTLIQPVIWMGLFGRALNLSALAGPGPGAGAFEALFGTSDYFSYMAVGMLSLVVLFTAMLSGMTIIWDRRSGFLTKVLTTPVARGSVVVSKVLATVARSVAQAGIVLLAALALGLRVGAGFHPVFLVGVFGAVFLLSMGISSFFITFAIRSRRWETQVAVINLLNLPLLFASNALFPTALMPDWLQALARVNPVTYATDAARQFVLRAPDWSAVAGDFLFLGAFAAVFGALGVVLSWRFLSK